jgi:transcriptional regulator with GAF, ATPase, and Fis domain
VVTVPRDARLPSLEHSAANEPESPLTRIREQEKVEERTRVLQALQTAGGNVSHAARSLGLSRFQLLRRLSKHGLR